MLQIQQISMPKLMNFKLGSQLKVNHAVYKVGFLDILAHGYMGFRDHHSDTRAQGLLVSGVLNIM